jgi:Apea-like HEPN/ApeA N-terminal domain 1
MSEKFKLRSQFDTHGVFWKPETPDEKFTGRLVRKGRDIELFSSPILKDVNALKEFFQVLGSGGEWIHVLHGYAPGPCTLLGLQSFGPSGHTDFEWDYSLDYSNFKVSACIFGLHTGDELEETLASARLSFSGLNNWLPFRPSVENNGEAFKLIYKKNLPPIVDVNSSAINSRVKVDVFPRLESKQSGEYESKHESCVMIEPDLPQSLSWFLELAYRFENFFSILLGTSVGLLSVAVKRDSKTGWFVRRPRSRIRKADVRIWVRCDGVQLGTAILRWLDTLEAFRPFEALAYGTVRNSKLFVDTEFLSLAQAIESFHRVTEKTLLVDQPQFEDILASLQKSIAALCGDSHIASRLNESIQHANEPNFRVRITTLFSRVSKQNLERLIGDPVEFEQTLRQTRNFLTHPGSKKQSKVLTTARDIFLFNQKLHALLRLLVLIHLGFPEQLVIDPVEQQSSRWH